MLINEILALPDFDKAIAQLTTDTDTDKIEARCKAYDGEHAILTDPNRAKKTVGDTPETQRVISPTKEVLTYQKRIVKSAVTFLFGSPVTLSIPEGDSPAFQLLKDSWKRNKCDAFSKELARNLFVECKVAELWSVVKPKTGPGRLRVSLLSKKKGYSIYPHFDELGDMDAFTYLITVKNADGKDVKQYRIYTAALIVTAEKVSGKWDIAIVPNLLEKIPVVYYEQDEAEWEDVSTQIERSEYLLSDFGDTNSYNGAPIMLVKGHVDNLPRKEETGKVARVTGDENPVTGETTYNGGLEYVTWEQAPESITAEYGMLKDAIYSMTQTPDLSFSNVKGMSSISGIALRLMFSDAMFKAMDKQEIFAPGLDRRIAIMKAGLALLNLSQAAALDALDVDVKFNDVLPVEIDKLITALSTARGGEPIMSRDAAVRANPLVADAEKDAAMLAEEAAARPAMPTYAESFTI
jgi:SPP1 family phage portal protein